jgi:hypothetical protein
LAIRLSTAVWLAPDYGYLPDHLENLTWSLYAYDHGPWNVYDSSAGSMLLFRARGALGEDRLLAGLSSHDYNYPPFSAYLFWLRGWAWTLLDGERVQAPPHVSRRSGDPPVALPLLNTTSARLADASVSIAFDFLLAAGVAALLAALAPGERSPLGAAAFALTLLAPPIFLDSALWTQQDSWVACFLVWTLVFLIRERFARAGVCYGLALVTKPQAILLGPVLLYVAVALRFASGGSWRSALRMLRLVAAAALVVALVAAPFALVDARKGADGGAWRWLQRGYVEPIAGDDYARTTLGAFNLWWLDFLVATAPGDVPRERALDDRAALLGLPKHAWGGLLLGAAIALAWVLCARADRFAPDSWLACAFLVTFASFALPTRVHQRYVYYCIPFAIALAARSRAFAPALLALLVVGTAEMVSYRFAHRADARVATAALALLTLGALAYAYGVPARRGAGRLTA